jgi:hypothetical protein
MFVGDLWINGVQLDSVVINGKVYIRDSDIYLFSRADGYLDLVADKGINIGSATTNFSGFDYTGHLTFNQAARPWRDELGELLGMKKKGTRITDDLDNGMIIFSDSCVIADDWVLINVQLNHDKDLSAGIYPHLHWKQNYSIKPNWLIQYRWQINGGSNLTDWTSISLPTAAFLFAGITLNQISYCPEISAPIGSTISDIVQFKLIRDTANDSGLFNGADPYTGNAAAIMFDCHFQINSLGSTDEYSK